MADRAQDWAEHPALDRLRAELVAVAEREARAEGVRPAPRRSRPPRLLRPAAVLATLAVLGVIVALTLRDPGDEAVADIRDAPTAAERQGSFTFDTRFVFRLPTGEESVRQQGSVRYDPAGFRTTSTTGTGTAYERIGVGDVVYTRAGGDDAWTRAPLAGGARGAAAVYGPSGPSALSAVQALGAARDEQVVSGDERVDGLRTTHYRVAIDAATFLGARAATEREALRDVRGRLDVWLDADDLPRRLSVRFADGSGRVLTSDTRYRDYGRTEAVRPPAGAASAEPGPELDAVDPLAVNTLTLFAGDR